MDNNDTRPPQQPVQTQDVQPSSMQGVQQVPDAPSIVSQESQESIPTVQSQVSDSQVFSSLLQPSVPQETNMVSGIEMPGPTGGNTSQESPLIVSPPVLSTPPDSTPPMTGNSGESIPTPPAGDGAASFVYTTGGNTNKSFLHRISPLKVIIGFIAVTVLIVLFLLVVLPATKTANQKVTLTYWGLWESPAVMQSTIADFERQNPNIHVQYSMEDPHQYSERLLTRTQLGTGPDIFRFHNTWVPMLTPILLPLSTDIVSKNDFSTLYYPTMQKDLIRNGAIYGLPLEIDTLSLFVNTSIFQAAGAKVPTNWDQFVTTARALTVKDATGKIKTAGASMGTYDNITHAADIMSLLFLQNGADIAHVAKTQQNASDALDFYQSFAKGDQNVWDNTLDQSMTAFAKGNLAMMFGYTWDIFNIKAASPNLSFGVYQVPHLPGRNMTIASYWVEGVSARSTHQKEAMLFLKFLAQKDTMQKLYAEEAKVRLFGEPYARSDMAQSLQSNPWLTPIVSQAPNAQSSIFAGETFDTGIDAQMNGYLGNAIRSGFVGTSATSAITTLGQGVDQVSVQYGVK